MTAQGFVSPTLYNTAFITRIWGLHRTFEETEKRGFYQFAYLATCIHVENMLSSIISKRLDSAYGTIQYVVPASITYTENNITDECNQSPIFNSILDIISKLKNDVESATITKLIELYNKIFNQNFRKLIGAELDDDLQGLASLRNLFGHGRKMFVEFTGESTNSTSNGEFILDKKSLEKPFKRLWKAGIIEKYSNIDGDNFSEFLGSIYNDKVFLYFYKTSQEIEKILENSMDYRPEKGSLFFKHLPDLED